jgi:hypothetical protein
MARRTKFQPRDLVFVQYSTRRMSETFFGKVIEYVSEQRMYRVGLLARPGWRGRVEILPRQLAVLCPVGELRPLPEEQANALQSVSYLAAALPKIPPYRSWYGVSAVANVSRGIRDGLVATRNIPTNGDLTAIDVSGYGTVPRCRWFNAVN